MSNNDEPSITTSPSIDIPMDVDFVGHHESAMVPEHSSLFCLAFYLHLGFDDEQHRVKQINDLFFPSQSPASNQEMMGALQEDKLAFECYLKAKEALANQEIEEHVSDPNFHLLAEENKPENENVYTISFLVWAGKQGNTIPDHVMNDVKFLMEGYPRSKHYRDTMKRDFPILTNDDFQRLTKEPLWTLANAIMYLTGHSSLKDEQAIIDFINGKNLAKTIIEYAKDASLAKDLMLYGNADIEHEKDWLLNTKVKPSKLIEWAKTLPINIPILVNADTGKILDGKPTSGIERASQNLYIPAYLEFMLEATEALNLSPEKRTAITKITNWLDENWPTDLEGKSNRTIQSMATLLRRPEDKKGGNTPWKG